MVKCGGLHCRGCGYGDGGGAVVAVVVALVVIGAVGKAAGHVISDVGHVLVVALEVALITMAAAAGLGVACLLVWAGIRVHRWQASRRHMSHGGQIQPDVVRAEVIPPGCQAIEPPRPRLTGVEDLLAPAAIGPRDGASDPGRTVASRPGSGTA